MAIQASGTLISEQSASLKEIYKFIARVPKNVNNILELIKKNYQKFKILLKSTGYLRKLNYKQGKLNLLNVSSSSHHLPPPGAPS